MAAMDEPSSTESPPTAPTRDAGGDRAPNRAARLDRAPSDRYGPERVAAPVGPAQRAVRAIGVAIAGAAVIAFLGGPLSVTAGLLAVAVVVGLVVGSLVRPATLAAVGLALGSVVLGLLGVWLFSRTEGGVLDPITYLADVQGPLAPIQLILAAIAAIVGSR
jgi:hypothetical protein